MTENIINTLIRAKYPDSIKVVNEEKFLVSMPISTDDNFGVAKFRTEYFTIEDGIVKLSDSVIAALNKANTAYQLPSTGIPEDDLTTDVQAKLSRAEIALTGVTAGFGITVLDIDSEGMVSLNLDDSYIKGTLSQSNKLVTEDQIIPTGGIPESDLSASVRAKLNQSLKVLISPADWGALTNPDMNTIYFVGPYGTDPDIYYQEYMCINDNPLTWEMIGSTGAIDLSNYFTKAEINALLAQIDADKLDKVSTTNTKARVYIINPDGSQSTAEMIDQINSNFQQAGKVPVYRDNGQLYALGGRLATIGEVNSVGQPYNFVIEYPLFYGSCYLPMAHLAIYFRYNQWTELTVHFHIQDVYFSYLGTPHLVIKFDAPITNIGYFLIYGGQIYNTDEYDELPSTWLNIFPRNAITPIYLVPYGGSTTEMDFKIMYFDSTDGTFKNLGSTFAGINTDSYDYNVGGV